MKQATIFFFSVLLISYGCRKIEVDDNSINTGGGNSNLILTGKIASDRTLESGKTYVIRGIVYVVDGAKLTVQPGTTILGEKSSRGTLVITRGSQLIAEGTVG